MPLDQTPGGMRRAVSAAGPPRDNWLIEQLARWRQWRARRRELRAQWFVPYPDVEPDWDALDEIGPDCALCWDLVSGRVTDEPHAGRPHLTE